MHSQASPAGQPVGGEGLAAAQPGGQAGHSIDQALRGGAPQRVGQFEYRYDSDTWSWSDAVATMHGYRPGEVEPSTQLVLSHKHPEDLAHVRDMLSQSAAPFSSRHRIYTTTGDMRDVVVVGDAVKDEDGRTVATRGFYVDVTEGDHARRERIAGEQREMADEHRGIVDQAKGMLMLACRIDADAALGILRWRSHELDAELGWVAERVVVEFPAFAGRTYPGGGRVPIEQFLVTLTPPGANAG